jgi:hypothetical protein
MLAAENTMLTAGVCKKKITDDMLLITIFLSADSTKFYRKITLCYQLITRCHHFDKMVLSADNIVQSAETWCD